ncbi:maleylpyruvate isomerase family mycothiol-dependent enzyme [Nonomuraea zeae]|uniref:Maleylpyruvate isomerase family mycothiol-dependent enzyme n=1 Tax=Nonomuraea zeae TaxID=1642303 RepID=A0A5S4GH42_9ACTN|nr:maleylpyruvate isomerase family mycothiol-dependent enzyme [Nonomuraea zeae]TMR31844.1 maleylpyruvate isomerase family mycothiol-dependent enzyme [Nonomuraea zeae]
MIDKDVSWLLPPAIEYALECVSHITQESLTHQTPCAEWNLAELLSHVNDSLAILHEGAVLGFIAGDPMAVPGDLPADNLVQTFTGRARQFLAAVTPASGDESSVAIADRVLSRDIMIAVGVVEVAIHGWDIACSCNVRKPIPAALASGIMEIVPMLVTDDARAGDFGRPVLVSPLAGPSDRLLAFLGREGSAQQFVN